MTAASPHFGDRLAEAVARRESQIVLGLDPDPARLWPAAREAADALAADLDATTAALSARSDDPSGTAAPATPADIAAAAILRAEDEPTGVYDVVSPAGLAAEAIRRAEEEPTAVHDVVTPSGLAADAIRRAEEEAARQRRAEDAVAEAAARAAAGDDVAAAGSGPRSADEAAARAEEAAWQAERAGSRGAVASRAIAAWRAQTVAGAAVGAHCRALIDAAGPACVAIKPQLACFERLGQAGVTALRETIDHAREAGLLVLLDGKRGDVPVTAAAYGQALAGATPSPWGELQGLGGDAFTANPLLGLDALAPLVETGAGVFVLVRTSNPGATDVLDVELADGGPLWAHLARLVDGLGDAGPASGLKSVGAVTGATRPEHLARLRELMPRTPFLLPGVGAQGGDVAALGPAFAPGRAGGLVTASRSIANAGEAVGADPAAAARAEAERLRALAWSLAA